MSDSKKRKGTINAIDYMKSMQDSDLHKYSKIAGIEKHWSIELVENNGLLQIVKDKQDLINTFKVYYPNYSFLKTYDTTILGLKGAIEVFHQNPYFKELQNLNKWIKEYKEAKKEAENNIYHLQSVEDFEYENKKLQEKNKEQEDTIKTLLLKIKSDSKFIDNYLNRLSALSEQKSIKTLTLNPNFDNSFIQIETIYKETQTIFISKLEQWQNLFSKDIQIFKEPIELKPKTTLADLRLFLDEMKTKSLIKNGRFNKILENVKAFSFNGQIVKATQYKRAKQTENYPYTLNYSKIENIFKALNVD